MHEHLTDIVDLGLKEHCSSTDKRIRQLRPLLYVKFTLTLVDNIQSIYIIYIRITLSTLIGGEHTVNIQ